MMGETLIQLIEKIEEIHFFDQISYTGYKELMALARTLQIEE